MKVSSICALAALSVSVCAGPTPLTERELDPAGNVAAILQGITTAVSQGDPTGVLQALRNVSPIASGPTTPQEAIQDLQAIFNGTAVPPTTIAQYIANLRALNLIDSIDSLWSFVNGIANGQSSTENNNPPTKQPVYPQKLSCDTPYTVDENTLRSAIYIPSTFTYGKVPPIILFPGTGNFGYETFAGNFIPLLTNSGFADPVWVNVPDRLLADAQKNAEFAAYAINYISAITGSNTTILAWSQGNIDVQWAFKYWPSTTQVTSDHVAVSPDYAGTIMANFLALPGEPLPASVLQQEYLASSNFITTLRRCDGDSGYVPTTTIYSGFFDEIVEPQQGEGASAFLKDVRGVGVTNNQVQLVCPGQPAGAFYTHEGVLYNPLSYFLLRDAMNNPGSGRVSRLNLQEVCATYLTPGLDLGDLLVTENAIAIAGLAILAETDGTFVEPPIAGYAAGSTCPVSSCLTTSTTTSSISLSTSTSSATLTITPSKVTTTGSSTTSMTSSSYSSSSTGNTSNSESNASTSLTWRASVSTSSTSTMSAPISTWGEWSDVTTTSISYAWGQWSDLSATWQPSEPTARISSEAGSWASWSSAKGMETLPSSDMPAASTWVNWEPVPAPSLYIVATRVTLGGVSNTQYTRVPIAPADGFHGSEWESQTMTAVDGQSTDDENNDHSDQDADAAIQWKTWSAVDDGGMSSGEEYGNVKSEDSSSMSVKPTQTVPDLATWSLLSGGAYTTSTGEGSLATWVNVANNATGATPAATTGNGLVKTFKGTAAKMLISSKVIILMVGVVFGLVVL